MLIILLGAVLMFGGLLFVAAQPIRGRLSSAKRASTATPEPTLEPPRPGAGFSPKENWPGLVLIVLGGVLLLIGW